MNKNRIARILVCAAFMMMLVMGSYSYIYNDYTAGNGNGNINNINSRLEESGSFDNGADEEIAVIETLRRFRLDCGIETSGITNMLTICESGLTPERSSAILRIGDSSDGVKRLQRRLTELGWYSGELDGEYGMELAEVVRRYQSADGLPVDGNAGIRTLLSLGLNWDENMELEYFTYKNTMMRLACAIEHEAEGEPVNARIAVGAMLIKQIDSLSFGCEASELSIKAAGAVLRGIDPLGNAVSYSRSKPNGRYVKFGRIYFTE